MNTTLSYELVAAEASRCGIFILMGPIAFTCLPVKRIANSFAGLNLTNGYTGRAVKDVIDSSLNLIVRIQEIRQCSTRSNSLRAAGGGARVIRPRAWSRSTLWSQMDSQFRHFAVTLSDDVAVETSICIIPASAPC
jgi:hypothetical protein